MADQVERWIQGEESAQTMLARVLSERPLLILPPLHRVPLRVGNVVEIVGPSSSAKTQILIQVAISCILPKEWNGVKYGGLEHLAMFFDLDCHFDILRFSQSLKHRIMEANGSRFNWAQEGADILYGDPNMKHHIEYDKELFAACMRRFLYVRCYDSSEFLATLKTLHYRLQKEREIHGVDAHFLMIDSIGTFYWIDRSSMSFAIMNNNRKSHSLQYVSETVVKEIRKLLLVHPMLVLATKAARLVDRYSSNDAKLDSRNTLDTRHARSVPQILHYREYMPLIWQSFVTHRVLVRASELEARNYINGEPQKYQTYLTEWLLPSLNIVDKFVVTDAGVWSIP